jgi:hypothetical protein
MDKDQKDRRMESIFNRLSYLYNQDELSMDDIQKLDRFLHRDADKVQEKSVEVVIHNEYGNTEKYQIVPDSVRHIDNGTIEETYTFKLYSRDRGLL